MARRLTGVFANNEWKIIPYAIYHDLMVNAVLDNEGNLAVCDEYKLGERCTMFYLNSDKIYDGVVVKSMKMSDFIECSKEQNVDYIDLCNSSQSHKSRIKIKETKYFKKEYFDDYIKEHPSKEMEFSFLDENSVTCECDNDKIVFTKTKVHEIVDHIVEEQLLKILKKTNCRNFEELFELVEKARYDSNDLN